MSSTARRRNAAEGRPSSPTLLNGKGSDAGQEIPAKDIRPISTADNGIRFNLKIVLSMLSVICFGIALAPYFYHEEDASGITFDGSQTPSSSASLPPTKRKEQQYRSPLSFPLTPRGLTRTPVRTADVEKQAAVKEAFRESWNAYVEDAFGADEYHPISRSGTNFSTDGGVGYFIIDTLDVLLLMGEKEGYEIGREWVRRMDWSQRKGKFSVFEVGITSS